MGTWMFARVLDMFTFFRSSDGLKINPSHWAEKLQHGTHGGRDGAKVYDQEIFASQLLAQLSEYYGFEGKKLAEVTQAVKDEVLSCDCKYDLMIAARDFTHRFSDGNTFRFDSCELPDAKDYAYHYIWCLYAIVWGIQQWDAGHARCHVLTDVACRQLHVRRKQSQLLRFTLFMEDLHRPQPARLVRTVQFPQVTKRSFTGSIGCAYRLHQRPIGVLHAVLAAVVRPQKHSGTIVS